MAKKSSTPPAKTSAAPAAPARAGPKASLKVGKRDMPPNPPTAPSKELHVFPNPTPERDYVIQFQIPEFTCHCPLTGQPDFAHFTIDMICDERCIELKSLKMYMWSYRDEGAFHEKVTNTILDDLVTAVQPQWAEVVGDWNVRGGIGTRVIATHGAR